MNMKQVEHLHRINEPWWKLTLWIHNDADNHVQFKCVLMLQRIQFSILSTSISYLQINKPIFRTVAKSCVCVILAILPRNRLTYLSRRKANSYLNKAKEYRARSKITVWFNGAQAELSFSVAKSASAEIWVQKWDIKHGGRRKTICSDNQHE